MPPKYPAPRAPVYKWKCPYANCGIKGIGTTKKDADQALVLHKKARHSK